MTLVDDVRRLSDKCRDMAEELETVKSRSNSTYEAVNGERGLAKEVRELRKEVLGEIATVKRAAYWLAGLIITSSIAFAFSVLVFFA